mmetsp:Transcript_39342/g.92019  ORF Transcript_39342/g.92019 Transcript_39342/m.92019 type:complete len:431 (-) Transcript_39342:577-1869(-)
MLRSALHALNCCASSEDDDDDCSYARFEEAVYTSASYSPTSLEDFSLQRVIGRGTYGKVLLVRRLDSGSCLAMKSMRKADVLRRAQVAHMFTELSVLQRAQHPFIAQLHCSFQTDALLLLVLAFYPGGELFFHLRRDRRFSEPRARLYSAEVALALQALHQLDIAYRDLKPENVLLDAVGHVRLSDFGLAKERVSALDGGARTCCGTPSYMAPEVLLGTGHTLPVDWWALGTLLFEMLFGVPPFYSSDVDKMYHSILYGELRIPSSASRSAKRLLTGLLQREPKRRLGTRNDKAVTAAAFFRSLSMRRVLRREYTPAFQPALRDAADTSYFAPEFTKEPAAHSFDERSDGNEGVQVDGGAFAGWDSLAVRPCSNPPTPAKTSTRGARAPAAVGAAASPGLASRAAAARELLLDAHVTIDALHDEQPSASR